MSVVAGVMIALALTGAGGLQAQKTRPPCHGSAYQLLDFWVGSWDVTVGGKHVGSNRIEKTLDGCAIVEHWKDGYGSQGKSLFYYEPTDRVWKQVWVTDRGRVKEKQSVDAGAPNAIRFQGPVRLPDGTQVLDRTTLTRVPDGRVRQHIEESRDNGRTWVTTFDAVYTKKPPSVGAQPTAGFRIVPVYDAFRDHDPARPERTQSNIRPLLDTCGQVSPMYEPLRLDTSRATAVTLLSHLDAARVTSVIESAYKRAQQILPGPAITVCTYLVEFTRAMPYMSGVGGVSIGSGRIHVYLHPTKDGFAKLPYTIAHEYYHEVERRTAPPFTPDEVLVSEGKADYFALKLYPDSRPPHTIAKPSELRAAWDAFQTHRLQDRATFRSHFMIAAPPSPLPIWAGYKLGFELARRYLATRNLDPRRWAAIPPEEMIKEFRLERP